MTNRMRDAMGRFVKQNGQPPGANYRLGELIGNVLMSRQELIKGFLDPRRDIDDECGYPKTSKITGVEYRLLYDREPIATRVVQVFPQESWKVQPTIFETEDVEEETEFEKAWVEVVNGLRGASWFQDEEGNPVWEALRRADELSGIGSYGVMLLGVDDGQELEKPLAGLNEQGEATGSPPELKLLYLRSFDEALADITIYESDKANPRFGQPVFYNLTFNDPRNESMQGIGMPLATMKVHWTRVIHLADNLGSSEVFGVPRMRPVYNRLLDLMKLYGGSAEMYWRGAFPGLSIETHPQLGPDVSEDLSATRDQLEQYYNGLQRYLALTGVSAKSLAPQVVDPTPQINVQVEAICIEINTPKRIFTGSERGELASSQDTKAWNGTVRGRQNGYITPRVIVPFVDRIIAIGVLPKPKGYSVTWPDLEALTDEAQADVTVKRTEALAKYVQGDVHSLIPPIDYLVRFLNMDREEAETIIAAALEQLEEEETEEQKKLEQEAKQEIELAKAQAGGGQLNVPGQLPGVGGAKGNLPPRLK